MAGATEEAYKQVDKMVETIRKKISIDKSRSHTAGIMPYILYNSDDQNVKYISMDDNSGNWGGFPLDLAFAKEITEEGFGGINVKKFRYDDGEQGCRYSTTENRLKYADIMRRYYEIQKLLEDGIYGIGVVKKFYADEKVTCSEGDDCQYDSSMGEPYDEVVLTTRFDDIEMIKEDLLGNGEPIPEKYLFRPVPIEDFEELPNGLYRATGETELIYDAHYVIIKDYDKYVKYEELWRSWWERNGVNIDTKFVVEGEYFKFCKAVEKYFIGKVLIPDYIKGIRVPQYIYYADIEDYKDWFEKNGLTSEAALVGKPKDILKRLEENGGLEFYRYLVDLGNHAGWIIDTPHPTNTFGLTYVTPYISVPVSLEDEHEFGGIYENYIYSYSEKDENFYEAYSDFDGYEGKEIKRWYEPEEEIYADSMLSYVLDDGATEINNITGVWEEFYPPKIFKCTFVYGQETGPGERVVENVKVGNGVGYWKCDSISSSDIECGDGEDISQGERKYRSITLLDCIRDVEPAPYGTDTYYFLVRKDNDAQHPFRIPYSVGSFHNMTENGEKGVYIGDYVTSMEVVDDKLTIQYVIGGLARSNDGGLTFTPIDRTGTKYEETYDYKEGLKLKTFVDGHDGVTVYYNSIDTESNKELIYSEEFRLYRRGNRAKIIGMEVGGIFAGEGKNAIKAMLFTRDGSEYLPDDTKNEFDVLIDRGNAAAFERHFKLSECNTFEDLKNYGNNFYKL